MSVEDVCQALLILGQSAYGPCGSLQCIKSPLPNFAKNSGQIADDIDRLASAKSPLRSPICRLLLQQVQTHSSVYGDGGLALLILATSLTLHARLHLKECPIPFIEHGYQMALEWTLEFLSASHNPTRVPIKFDDTSTLLAAIGAVIDPNPLLDITPEVQLHLRSQIFLHFLNTLPDSTNKPMHTARIQQCLVEDATSLDDCLTKTTALSGVLIDWELPMEAGLVLQKWSQNGTHEGKSISAILFDICIQPTAAQDHITMVKAGDEWFQNATANSKPDWFADFSKALMDLGVQVLLSQKTIHPRLKLMLLRRNILPIERLSIRHIHAVRDLTGCTIISDAHPPQLPSVLGSLTSIREKTLSGKRYIHMDNEAIPTSTLLLVANTRHALASVEVSVQRALVVLRSIVFQGDGSTEGGAWGVTGAGAFEFHLVQYLMARKESLQHQFPHGHTRVQIMASIDGFIASAQALLGALIRSGANPDVLNAIEALEAHNQAQDYYKGQFEAGGKAPPRAPSRVSVYGWDPINGMPTEVLDTSEEPLAPTLVDSIEVKKNVFASALEVALMLISIDMQLIDLE